MRPLNISRYEQDPAHCAVAAAASIANYYNPDIDYDVAKTVAKTDVVNNLNEGLYSAEIGLLLNHLGFKKVTIVTCELEYVDYGWAKMTKQNVINDISRIINSSDEEIDDEKLNVLSTHLDFLNQKNMTNNLVIDHHFSKYIRKHLCMGKPILISFNWTMFFQYPRSSKASTANYSSHQYPEYHAVVVRGYNSKNVHIVDSHIEYYKHNLKRFRKGYYSIPWEELMTIIGTGDVIIPEKYSKDNFNYELV